MFISHQKNKLIEYSKNWFDLNADRKRWETSGDDKERNISHIPNLECAKNQFGLYHISLARLIFSLYYLFLFFSFMINYILHVTILFTKTLEFIYQLSLTTLLVFENIIWKASFVKLISNASKFEYLLTWRQGLLLHLWVLKDAEFSNLNGSL